MESRDEDTKDLPYKEFQKTVMKLFSKKQRQEFKECVTKEIQALKRYQIEILEIKTNKNTMESHINRMSKVDGRISELEGQSFKNTQTEIWKSHSEKLRQPFKN